MLIGNNHIQTKAKATIVWHSDHFAQDFSSV